MEVRCVSTASSTVPRVAEESTQAPKRGTLDDLIADFELTDGTMHERQLVLDTTRVRAKGTGEIDGVTFEEVVYEGYGPGGTAVMVDCLTDNRNRTVAEVRHAFTKFGGNLGAEGSVSFMFDRFGVFRLKPEGFDREEMELELIEPSLFFPQSPAALERFVGAVRRRLAGAGA